LSKSLRNMRYQEKKKGQKRTHSEIESNDSDELCIEQSSQIGPNLSVNDILEISRLVKSNLNIRLWYGCKKRSKGEL
jgi:hypothetical protein